MNMNNEQKNTHVKMQITAALLELLKEKPLSDITVSELTNKADFIENGSYHYLEVTDIPAYELDQKKTFRVGDDEHYFSALEYAALMQTKTDPEKNLGTALYWYNQAAKEYFG